MSGLGEMVGSGEPSLVDIPLYYKVVKNDYGSQIIVIEDDVAKDMLEDEEKKEEIEVLNTRWLSSESWKDQNQNVADCTVSNPMNGQDSVDWSRYRDLKIKRSLKEWDLKNNGVKIEVSAEAIDRLPAHIVMKLYAKFDAATAISGEDQSKS